MDFDLFKKIVFDASDTGIKFIQLSFYGECLLDRKLVDKVEFIRKNFPDITIQITTNGSLLTEEASQRLLDAGVHIIKISIEGNNASEFNKVRKNLDYERVLNNIKKLKTIRDQGNVKTQIKISGLNLEECPLDKKKYKEFWGQYADSVYVRDEHKLKMKEKESFVSRVMPCHHLLTSLVILADGSYTICPVDWYGKAVYGSIKNTTIKQAWFASKLNWLKLTHLFGMKKTIDICKQCPVRVNYSKLFD